VLGGDRSHQSIRTISKQFRDPPCNWCAFDHGEGGCQRHKTASRWKRVDHYSAPVGEIGGISRPRGGRSEKIVEKENRPARGTSGGQMTSVQSDQSDRSSGKGIKEVVRYPDAGGREDSGETARWRKRGRKKG